MNIQEQWIQDNDSDTIREEFMKKSITRMGVKIGIQFGRNYIKYRDKLVGKFDSSDHFVMKYFANIGFFRTRFRNMCTYCNEENSREHAFDKCAKFTEIRNMNQKKFSEIRSIFKGKEITEILNYIFYANINKYDRRLSEQLKNCITDYYKSQ